MLPGKINKLLEKKRFVFVLDSKINITPVKKTTLVTGSILRLFKLTSSPKFSKNRFLVVNKKLQAFDIIICEVRTLITQHISECNFSEGFLPLNLLVFSFFWLLCLELTTNI